MEQTASELKPGQQLVTPRKISEVLLRGDQVRVVYEDGTHQEFKSEDKVQVSKRAK